MDSIITYINIHNSMDEVRTKKLKLILEIGLEETEEYT